MVHYVLEGDYSFLHIYITFVYLGILILKGHDHLKGHVASFEGYKHGCAVRKEMIQKLKQKDSTIYSRAQVSCLRADYVSFEST